MADTTIVTPIVHLNGDRRETLLTNLENAYCAVREAMSALNQCAPHGRNYYLEDGRLERAQAQHRERQDHLHAVYKSLERECIQILDENPRK